MREEDDELPHYRGRRAGCGVGNPRSVVSGFDGVSTISLEKTAPRALNRKCRKSSTIGVHPFKKQKKEALEVCPL